MNYAEKLIFKFQDIIITEIYRLITLFNSRFVIQNVFSFRILTMIDWKQKIYSDTIKTPFYFPKKPEQDNFSIAEVKETFIV